MSNKIKSFGHIHQAAEDITAIPQEVADSFKDSPGTHIARDTWLVGKLKIVDPNGDTKQDDNNPIKQLKDKTANSYGSVVAARVDTTKLILNDWN